MDIINSIAEQVARREGTSPTGLTPLYDVVDPDALQRVIDSAADADVRVELTYSGYVVTVAGDGSVELRPTGDVAEREADP